LYRIGKALVAPLTHLAWRPTVSGMHHIPGTGPVILAANHLSVIDSLIIPSVVSRPVYYLAKDEYFRNPVTRFLLSGLNQIPVDRSGGRASLLALDAALPVLRGGGVLGIFPEGTRSPDGRLYRGRPGVAKLALETGATIVPTGLRGTDAVQPIGARLPKLFRSTEVIFGAPLDLSPWRATEATSRTYREICERLMTAIAGLTAQEYVGRYAPRKGSPDSAD
jgi:1-acyl-sn-glycerol-3-phosphate acyltransferase